MGLAIRSEGGFACQQDLHSWSGGILWWRCTGGLGGLGRCRRSSHWCVGWCRRRKRLHLHLCLRFAVLVSEQVLWQACSMADSSEGVWWAGTSKWLLSGCLCILAQECLSWCRG